MKAIVFGAAGIVGQGVLRECLLEFEVSEVLAIGRTSPAGSCQNCARWFAKAYSTYLIVAS